MISYNMGTCLVVYFTIISLIISMSRHYINWGKGCMISYNMGTCLVVYFTIISLKISMSRHYINWGKSWLHDILQYGYLPRGLLHNNLSLNLYVKALWLAVFHLQVRTNNELYQFSEDVSRTNGWNIWLQCWISISNDSSGSRLLAYSLADGSRGYPQP